MVKRRSPVCYYVMNLAKYGELFRLAELSSNRFSEPLVENLLKQLLEGLDYLHSIGVVHRDIKPENLLIDKNLRLIIADFNFATTLTPIKFSNEHEMWLGKADRENPANSQNW